MSVTFYKENKQLDLETDASGVRLGAGLLQLKDRMQFPRDEVPDKSVLPYSQAKV